MSDKTDEAEMAERVNGGDARALDLEAIKARVGRAMDGPWDYNPDARGTEGSPGLTGYRDGATCPVFTSTAFWSHSDGVFAAAARADVPALVAEVERLRLALDGLVKINAEDFPETDGKIDWSAFPVTFGYAMTYRAALVALGREKP